MITKIDPWQQFLAALQNDILPVYARHEDEFDRLGIHGRLHICRSIVLAEVMSSMYGTFAEIDRFAIRYAVAFHDSGSLKLIRFWHPESIAIESEGNLWIYHC